jgi:hypothetical protein
MDENQEFEDAFAEFADSKRVEEPEETEREEPQGEEDAPAQEEPEREEGGQEDPLAALTDDQRDYLKKIEEERDQWRHRFQSDAGRVGALQRKINELETQLTSSASKSPEQPSQREIEGAIGDDKKLDEFKEDYPEFADAIQHIVESRLQKEREALEEKFGQQIKPIHERFQKNEQEQYFASQYAALEAAHPDWQSVGRSQEFMEWVKRQPPIIQQAANSDDAHDVSFVLDTFKGQRKPARTQESRRTRLEQNVSVKSRGAAPTGPPDDFEGAFDYYARKT